MTEEIHTAVILMSEPPSPLDREAVCLLRRAGWECRCAAYRPDDLPLRNRGPTPRVLLDGFCIGGYRELLDRLIGEE